jgi:hypothetical protein
MNHEEMERAIEFLLEHDSRFNEAINRVKESIDRLTTTQEKTSANIQGLTDAQTRTTNDLHLLTGKVLDLAEIAARLEAQAEADRRGMRESINGLREEMRDGFNKLILANEVTRDLAQNVARLAIATSQRVTTIESKLE